MEEAKHRIYPCVLTNCLMEEICLYYAQRNPHMESSLICQVGNKIGELFNDLAELAERLEPAFEDSASALAMTIITYNLAKQLADVRLELEMIVAEIARMKHQAQPPGLSLVHNILNNPEDPENGSGGLH